MFHDIGGKVKALAKFFCGIGIIASVVGGLIVCSASNRYVDTTGTGVLIIIFGSLLSWIGSWALFAIGSAAEDAAAAKETNQEILKILKTISTNTETMVSNSILSPDEGATNSSGTASSADEATETKSFKKIELVYGPWKCPNCRKQNPFAASRCQNCDVPREY